MGKKKATSDDEADNIELDEEEDDVEMEDDDADEDGVAEVHDDEEDNEDDETEDEGVEVNVSGVDVRDSKLAEGIPTANFNTFMQDVLPILKKNGWEKIPGPQGAFDVLTIKKNVDFKKARVGVTYYETVLQVVNRINRRETAGEAAAADRYRRAIAKPRQPFSPTFEPTQKRRGRKPIDPELKVKLAASKRFPKRTSQIGDDYQATDIPVCGTKSDAVEEYAELIWDPAQAKAAGIDLADDKDPIAILKNPHLREAAFRKLKELNYDLAALDESKLKALDGSDWTEKQRTLFEDEIFRLRRDLLAVAKLMNLPVSVCHAYYLGTYKHSVNYRILKSVCIDERDAEKFEFEPDACAICGDGGNLLICDGCEREFHMTCMDHVLKDVPEGSWECDECVNKKFLLAREHLIRHSLLYEKGASQSATATGKDLYLAVPVALEAVQKFADELHDIFASSVSPVVVDADGDAEMKVEDAE